VERITRELDRIASAVENSKKLSPEDRLVIAKMIDDVSDHLDQIGEMDKKGAWLSGDADESYMEKFDEAGAVLHDADEKYMEDYTEERGKGKWENMDERQRVLEEYQSKHEPGYEVRDLNTDVYDMGSGTESKVKAPKSARQANLSILANLKKRK